MVSDYLLILTTVSNLCASALRFTNCVVISANIQTVDS